MSRDDSGSSKPLLSLRAAVILLLALLVGAATAGLILLADRTPAEAVLGGCAAVAAAVKFFSGLIGPSNS